MLLDVSGVVTLLACLSCIRYQAAAIQPVCRCQLGPDAAQQATNAQI
jgi:hypothetical protein